jgi:FAD/FMN-containing dehydrogenase
MQHLIDHHEIVQVTHRYCWALDGRQFHDLHNVFLADATANLGGEFCEGLDAIIARITRALTPLDDSQHTVSTHHVRIDGDTATSRCYLVAQHVRKAAEGSPLYIVAGRYEDRLERSDEGWRIRHRDLIVMWTDGNPNVPRKAL